MTFSTFNSEMNYYSSRSKVTGNNEWNQNSIQSKFTKMISSCNLTKEQIDKISKLMILNDESLDMKPSNNKSVQEFDEFATSKTEELSTGLSQKVA